MRPFILNYSSVVKNFLNKLYSTCEQACIKILNDKYYTIFFNIITNYNDHNNTPLSYMKIW